MARINSHFLKLKAGYLFPEIARRVTKFQQDQPELAQRLIRCGIGDVTEALPAAAIAAMHEGVDELAQRATFKGYGPEQGYAFLREAIAQHAYAGLGIAADEIFISDGSKCDTGNILDIFGTGNRIAITDPVYPVYVDTNVMAGNTGEALESGGYAGLVYLQCHADNGFVPLPPDEVVDIVYLCFPNNPTGAVATAAQLQAWVDYANRHGSILLFDSAYEAFIQHENHTGLPESAIPRSIYEIPGAHQCAIEFRSFSKHGGFTGVRCAYTVIPKTLLGQAESGEEVSLHSLWLRRQSTKFNGASYPVQKAAAALFSDAGKQQVKELIHYYMENARLLRHTCQQLGLTVFGGENAPYVWVSCPQGKSSWEVFDWMLQEFQIVITPGSGFGAAGEGWFRISAFNSRANVEEVCRRLLTLVN